MAPSREQIPERYIIRAFNELGKCWYQRVYTERSELDNDIEMLRALAPESKIQFVDVKNGTVEHLDRIDA